MKATHKMVNNRSLKCYKLKFKLLGPDAACHTFSLDWEKLHRERLGTRKFNQPLKKKKNTNTLHIISESYQHSEKQPSFNT